MSISFRILPQDLDRVAVHYQEERRVYLMARHEARMRLAKKHKCNAIDVVLPDY